jgi:N-acetylglucosamine malate deacetylase 1
MLNRLLEKILELLDMIDFRKARVLVLGAHPDDETMCGGLIARLADSGSEIHHHYFSDCAVSTIARGHDPATLLSECEESRNILGISTLGRGGFTFPVREFPSHRQAILEALVALRKDVRPTLVLTAASDDVHQDHATLTTEAIRAFKGSTILGYEMPWNQLYAHHDCLVALQQSHLDRKLMAIAAYRSQTGSAYVAPEFTTSLAKVRGVQAGCNLAESYQLIRLVI